MIPANAPYEASYEHESNGRTHYTTKPVIAWDDDGYPLVVGRDGCQLDRANGWSNFHAVHPCQSPVVATLPGAGWIVEFNDDAGPLRLLVVAWLVRAEGSVDPVCVDPDGLSHDPTDMGNFVKLYHPDEEETP
ncbi:hypothetical protein AN219_37725 [Streptomyces nanshensis]|nr:hypothetical protein AN219_37725 [Streptomyces nanshensis]